MKTFLVFAARKLKPASIGVLVGAPLTCVTALDEQQAVQEFFDQNPTEEAACAIPYSEGRFFICERRAVGVKGEGS